MGEEAYIFWDENAPRAVQSIESDVTPGVSNPNLITHRRSSPPPHSPQANHPRCAQEGWLVECVDIDHGTSVDTSEFICRCTSVP